MLFSYRRMMKPFNVIGTEGEIGSVSDLYFDDQRWTVRYIVADTGGLFDGKELFISPASIQGYSIEEERLHVSISEKEAKESPSPGNEPVSRQFEREFAQFYNLNPYWMGGGLWGAGMMPRDLTSEGYEGIQEIHESDSNVLSVKDVEGKELATADESFGKVKDLIVDDKSYTIRYIVADTKRWLPGGKEVLLSTDWIDDVDWAESFVRVNVTKEQIKNAPEYVKGSSIDREMETTVFKHYGKPKYWN
ncbi:PRC-barrel domain-containing protein [Bacillus sp. H-16]|uniref:PRC-barrel domain-containing protein n=1 Tax=Alteribacter salitolerans TaxID=2912333 RepID=UPI001963D3B1|nr:PRC-barrel domain-containing protein [Alteribacter salitolerans]MBM7097170.1 PRC-barrel domain-containing protein [Alteribacter salitolerans]